MQLSVDEANTRRGRAPLSSLYRKGRNKKLSFTNDLALRYSVSEYKLQSVSVEDKEGLLNFLQLRAENYSQNTIEKHKHKQKKMILRAQLKNNDTSRQM